MKNFPFEIELKDKRKIEIDYIENDNERAIIAKADKRIIAKASFEIIKKYTHKLTKEEKESMKNLYDSEQELNEIFTDNENLKDKITLNGLEYNLTKINGILKTIDIFDSNYLGFGIGSGIFKIVEKIMEEKNCESINAFVAPPPEMRDRTLTFYKRNGFVIENNDVGGFILTSAEKILSPSDNKTIEP